MNMRKLRFIVLVFLSIVAFTGCNATFNILSNNNLSVDFSNEVNVTKEVDITGITVAEPTIEPTTEPTTEPAIIFDSDDTFSRFVEMKLQSTEPTTGLDIVDKCLLLVSILLFVLVLFLFR